MPTQQPRRRGCAEARWRLFKGDLCDVLAQTVEAAFKGAGLGHLGSDGNLATLRLCNLEEVTSSF